MTLLSIMTAMLLPMAPMVQAPSASDLDDGTCIAALILLQEAAEAEQKDGINGAITFFIGKVIGRSGRDVVTATIQQASAKLAGSDLEGVIAPLAEKCAAEVEASVPNS